MRALRLALTLAACTLIAAPAQAATPLAQSDASPTGRLAVAPMTDIAFSAKLSVPVESAYVRVSATPPGPDGELIGSTEGGQMTREPFSDLLAWHLPVVSSIRANLGTYWWQIVGIVRTPNGLPQQVVGPVQRVDLYFPSSWSRRGPIDRRFGRHGNARFLLSSRGIPDGIDPARLQTIVAVSARRWGLRLTGWTSRPAGARDHTNVAGFGNVPAPGALAAQADFYERRYRFSRHCTEQRLNGVVIQRTCGPIQRQYLGKVLTDQDLVIRPDVPWAMGPARPTATEFDLESVLIHELGHMAGNKKHAPLCSNSPMGPTIGRGEWWRTPHDWYRRGCPLSAPRGLL